MSRDAVIATYGLAGDFPLEDAARVVAMEQSTGTWTPVAKRTGSLEDRLAAWVESTDKKRGLARVAYPLEIFEADNVAGVLSIVAGNLFGLGSLSRARLVDLEFPRQFAKAYPGPRHGIEGMRKLAGTSKDRRPHGGTIVKPKVGLDPKQTAAAARQAAEGGVDLIKDDETLTDQAFCPIGERTRLVMEALDQVRDATGHRTVYVANVTAGADEAIERVQRVHDAGGNGIMIDVLTAGFDALRSVRGVTKLPIHVHRTMHGALTRSPDFGISMLPLAKLVRLCGGDQLHVGSASGKMEHDADLPSLLHALRDDWYGLKPTFPVSSGGLHPASVPAEVKAFGDDVILQAGGGIHGHPGGARAGAKAFLDAIKATHGRRPLAKDPSPELADALKKWGDEAYAYQH